MSKRVPKSVVAELKQVPLFSNCTRRQLKKIAALGTFIPIGAGRELTVDGEPGSELFVVLSGRASCRVQDRRIDTFGPGDFFGELSLVDGGARTASVTAETPMELLDFDRREFARLLDVAPSVVRKMFDTLASRLRRTDGLIRGLAPARIPA